jgi:hypothetical protein
MRRKMPMSCHEMRSVNPSQMNIVQYLLGD